MQETNTTGDAGCQWGQATPASAPQQADRNQCTICGKCFDRKDTLRRHLRIHDHNRPPPKSRRRACVYCVKAKIKCFGERPTCSGCLKKRLVCVYELDASTISPANTEDHESASTSSVSASSVSEAQIPDISYAQDISTQLFPSRPSHDPNTQHPPILLASHFFGTNLTMHLNTDSYLHSEMDWVFHNSFDDVFPNPMEVLSFDSTLPSPSSFTVPPVPQRKLSEQNLHFPPSQSEAEVEPPVNRPQFTQLDDRGVPDHTWPMEWRAVPVQLSSLPVLRGRREDSPYLNYFSLPQVDDAALVSLQDTLQSSLQGSPWQTVSLTTFPNKEELNYFIDLYFVHFDKLVPIIHRPTFDPARESVLTLAVAAIGACYSGFEGARAFATSLSELIRRHLLFLAEYDPRFVRTESYVITQLLQAIHGFSSGSKRLYELAESNRSSLISNARCIKLFELFKSHGRSGDDLQLQWEAWIRAERLRRLAWAIYSLDASATYFHNSRPILSMTEIRMDLPCSPEHWEANSPQAWAALHPWTRSDPPTSAFRPIIDSLAAHPGSALEKVPDDYHRYLILSILVRTCWDMKESTHEPGAAFILPELTSPSNMGPIQSAMNEFARPLKPNAGTLAPREFEALVERMYMIRIGNVIAADDSVDYMHLIWAKGPRAQEAQDHLLQWAIKHPIKVRKSAYAAAQILSFTRQYPYNHPREPYNAFHGGFVLWTMVNLLVSTLSPEVTSPSRSGSESRRRMVCHLDWLGSEEAPEAQAIRDWIELGGNYIIRMHGVPDMLTEGGMQQILEQTADILKRMPVWGIAQTFLNAVLRFLRDDDTENPLLVR